LEDPNERGYLVDLGLERRIIIKRILKKYVLRMWTRIISLRIGYIVEVL
jgi:hypothetical protein